MTNKKIITKLKRVMTQARFKEMAEYYKSLNIFDDTDDNQSQKSKIKSPSQHSQSSSANSNLPVSLHSPGQSAQSSLKSKKSGKTSSADPFDGYFECLVGNKKKAEFLKKSEPSDTGGKFDHLFPEGLDDLDGL